MGTNASSKKTVAWRILAVLLAALMLVTMLPMTALAAPDLSFWNKVIVTNIEIDEPSGFRFKTYSYGEKFELADTEGLEIDVTYWNAGSLASSTLDLTNANDRLIADALGIKTDPAKGEAMKLSRKGEPLTVYVENGPKDTTNARFNVTLGELYTYQLVDFTKLGQYNGENFLQPDETYLITVDGVALTSKESEIAVKYGLIDVKALAGKDLRVNGVMPKEISEDVVTEDMQWKAELSLPNGYKIRSAKGGELSVPLSKDGQVIGGSTAPVVMSDNFPFWKTKNNVDAAGNADDDNAAKLYFEDVVPGIYGTDYYSLSLNEKSGSYYFTVENQVNMPGAKGQMTFDKANGNVKFYVRVPATLDYIRVTKSPTQMTYVEGDELDLTGMEVTLYYTNGKSIALPYEDFAALASFFPYSAGIVVTPANGTVLSIGAHNGLNLIATYAGFSATSPDKLQVTAKARVNYVLADKIEDGAQYLIVAGKDWTKSPAFTAEMPEFVALSSKTATILGQNTATTNIGKRVVVKDREVIANRNVTSDLYWSIARGANGSYTLKSNDGKYLARKTVKDLFGNKIPEMFHLDQKADAASNDALWEINGVNDARICSFGNDYRSQSYLYGSYGAFNFASYVGKPFPFAPPVVLPGIYFGTADWDALDGAVVDHPFVPAINSVSLKLFKVVYNDVAAMEIAAQPALTYVDGEKLDLSALAVKLTFKDASTVVVPYNNFNTYGITVDTANGKALTLADAGAVITVSLDKFTAKTDAITVLGADTRKFVLASELVSGYDYIIVYENTDNNGKKLAKALSCTVTRDNIDMSFNPAKTLQAKDVTVEDDKITSKVTSDMVWTINDIKNVVDGKHRYYEIVAADGKKLERDARPFTTGLTALTTSKTLSNNESLNNWQITSVKKGNIYTDGMVKDFLDYDFNLNKAFVANTATNFVQQNSISLYQVVYDGTITGLKIVKEPTQEQMTFEQGDKIENYGDLTVELTKNTKEVLTIKAADFAANGITATPALKTVATTAINGKGIVVSAGTLSAETATKFVVKTNELKATRIAGSDRIATAIEIANAGWTSADAVIVANAQVYADALAGVSLAKALDAPILLTNNGTALEASVKAEIEKLNPTTIYVLGGEKAISATIKTTLEGLCAKVTRLAGATRVETAIAIAKELPACGANSTEMFFVTGKANSFADALSVSTVAAIKGAPVLYVGLEKDGKLNADVANYMKSKSADTTATCIIGGTAAVPQAVEDEIAKIFNVVERVDGATRYETSLNVAKKYADIFASKDVAIATGKTFPDALAGGSFAAKKSIPVVLVDNASSNAAVKTFITNRFANNLYVFGGVNAVSDATVDALVK